MTVAEISKEHDFFDGRLAELLPTPEDLKAFNINQSLSTVLTREIGS